MNNNNNQSISALLNNYNKTKLVMWPGIDTQNQRPTSQLLVLSEDKRIEPSKIIHSEMKKCYSNEWLCGKNCIRKREYCTETAQCHPHYPIPCEDDKRCHRKVSDLKKIQSIRIHSYHFCIL